MKESYLATYSEGELGGQESSKGTNSAVLHFTTPSYLHTQKIGPEAQAQWSLFLMKNKSFPHLSYFFAHLSARIFFKNWTGNPKIWI